MSSMHHIPVMRAAVVQFLTPADGGLIVDCTLGLAGHAKALLGASGPHTRLIGLDADQINLKKASEELAPFGSRVTTIHCNFGDIDTILQEPADCIFADLGLSSPHIDDPERGFSFRADGPLDLRFDQSQGETAAELIHRLEPDELAGIFRHFGELFREARSLAAAMQTRAIETTADMRAAVEQACGYRAPSVLPRVFQALRIAVNDELGVLDHFLDVAPTLLRTNGRLGIMSYHSLEDRRVKHCFRALSAPERDPVTGAVSQEAPFSVLTPKAIIPTDDEIAINPRSRSAKFRVLVHTGA